MVPLSLTNEVGWGLRGRGFAVPMDLRHEVLDISMIHISLQILHTHSIPHSRHLGLKSVSCLRDVTVESVCLKCFVVVFSLAGSHYNPHQTLTPRLKTSGFSLPSW